MVCNEQEYLRKKIDLQEICIMRKELNSNETKLFDFYEERINELKQELKDYDNKYHSDRIGNWMPVYSGRRFWILDARPEDIDIEDIAQGLSNICRYNGHTRHFYSVSQHSVYAALLAPPEWAIAALFHDASESYIGDVISPLKSSLEDYKEIEYGIMQAVAEKYNFELDDEGIVKEIDDRLLATEVRDVFPARVINWKVTAKPYNFFIKHWPPEMAKEHFIWTYKVLTEKPDSISLLKELIGVSNAY